MMRSIVRMKFGSHLYGTSTPESDTDYKGVYLPSARNILLQQVEPVLKVVSRVKADGERNLPDDVDDESYSLQRYLQLLAEGQTVALDMLFNPAPEETSPLWELIQANKDRLITKKSAAFVGYCRTQTNKYSIKGSRVAAVKAAAEYWSRELDQHGAQAKVGEHVGHAPIGEYTEIVEKETTPGSTEFYFVCCNRLVGFKNTVKEAAAIYTRIYEAYGTRAREAESSEGVDWKALSHAVRVGHEALELLQTGRITFPLPNAMDILHIKQGKVAYPVVAQMIENLLVQVETAEKVSTLRDEPDWEWINDLVADQHCRVIRYYIAKRSEV